MAESIPSPSEISARHMPVVLIPRDVHNVVAWVGSIETFPDFGDGEELVQDLLVSLLDKGTRKRDRFALARDLEDRGAEVNFASQGTRVHFSGRALARDVDHVLALTAEQLIEPLLDAAEFDKSVQRLRASLRRSSLSTSYRSSAALRGRLFSNAHPNFTREPAADLELLAECTLDQIRSFHRLHFAGLNLAVCAAGDVRPDRFAAMIDDAFPDWGGEGVRGDFDASGLEDENRERRVVDIPDRDNLDVRIGHTVNLRRNDPDFLALYVANYILGGNFSARLMQKVRNELGLTYGIGSSLSGFDANYEGMWQTYVTLSKDRLEEGVETTLDVIEQFLGNGVTEDELETKKTTICGSYEVGLSTTRGLAQALHSNLRAGFPTDYLVQFPALVRGLTVDDVNNAIRKYLDFDRLRITIAGSIGRET